MSRRATTVSVCAAMALIGCTQLPEGPAAPPELTLTCQDTVPGEFVSVSGLVELPGGRVLVSDARDRKVVAVSMRSGTSEQIGREGEGPGEYTVPSRLFATPRGIWLYDSGRRRLLGLDGAATFVSSQAVPEELFSYQPVSMSPSGELAFEGPNTTASAGESTAVVRWRPGAGAFRTSIRVDATDRAMQAITSRQSGATRAMRLMMREPFSASDEWGLISDSTILVVRGGSATAELFQLDGSRIRSVSWRPGIPTPVTEADRDSLSEAGGGVVWALPASKPPLVDGSGLVDTMGRFWVATHGPSGAPLRYLIFGTSGFPVYQVSLPRGFAVLGFGTDAVYVGAPSEDGLIGITRCGLSS